MFGQLYSHVGVGEFGSSCVAALATNVVTLSVLELGAWFVLVWQVGLIGGKKVGKTALHMLT